ncbi:hypothetical protein Cadr_000016596 [Camelus dromedarius]|uniref:Uncharacterized protein n=1 Tax=Camelus dromedarius TaxID=9838 RepID=A0A5N4DFM8_CAMDR|nr:hypothetical protein Cadr_000016596 [Camelus dromedarius]
MARGEGQERKIFGIPSTQDDSSVVKVGFDHVSHRLQLVYSLTRINLNPYLRIRIPNASYTGPKSPSLVENPRLSEKSRDPLASQEDSSSMFVNFVINHSNSSQTLFQKPRLVVTRGNSSLRL